MNADPIDELFADLIGPIGIVCKSPTPAKAANAANREHPCGFAGDMTRCEDLRKAANSDDIVAQLDADSQEFAGVRRTINDSQSEQRRGFSQDSQDSQGFPGPNHVRLVSPAVRPYRLAPDDAEACHVPKWDDDEMARFVDRSATLRRSGSTEQDAEDLAERLTLRDRESDDRSLCVECINYRRGRCGNHAQAGLGAPDVGRQLAALLQRCRGFQAAPSSGRAIKGASCAPDSAGNEQERT